MGLLTIKEASDLVGKAPLTVRRRIYAAPDDKKSTNEKGHLLVDKDYIVGVFNITSNEPINDHPINDNSLLILSNELQNKQKTIDSLNDRLAESNHIIEGQRQELKTLSNTISDKVQLLLEAPKEPSKKPFPLLEVISITFSAAFLVAIIFYLSKI